MCVCGGVVPCAAAFCALQAGAFFPGDGPSRESVVSVEAQSSVVFFAAAVYNSFSLSLGYFSRGAR